MSLALDELEGSSLNWRQAPRLFVSDRDRSGFEVV